MVDDDKTVKPRKRKAKDTMQKATPLHDLVLTERQKPRKGYERTSVQTHPVGKTRTQSSHAQECDINAIMAKYNSTGVLTHVNSQTPMYGDFSTSTDYHTAMTAVREAERDFAALPANVRAACDNNPEVFLELMHDPNNREKADQLGLKGIFDIIHEIPEETTSSPPEASSSTPPETPESVPGPTLDETGTTDNSQ